MIGEQEQRIDMKVIEPYRRVISHGGTQDLCESGGCGEQARLFIRKQMWGSTEFSACRIWSLGRPQPWRGVQSPSEAPAHLFRLSPLVISTTKSLFSYQPHYIWDGQKITVVRNLCFSKRPRRGESVFTWELQALM